MASATLAVFPSAAFHMHVVYRCPACTHRNRAPLPSPDDSLHCSQCGWRREAAGMEFKEQQLSRCLLCGCEDLWRQKDFPPQLGLTMVALGALLSTIAWSYYLPTLAIGILMAFAMADLVLYTLMRDVLVCYRCEARYHQADLTTDETPRFSLELAERYRQEAARLKDAERRPA